jgi:HSP20 family molecular chaperone IbpA
MSRSLSKRRKQRIGDTSVPRSDLFWPFEQHFNELFDTFFDPDSRGSLLAKSGYPKMDIVAGDGRWKILVAVPGVKPEHIKVELLEDRVRISGKMEEEYRSPEDSGTVYHIKELRASSFSREVLIPDDLRKQEPRATVKDGMLELSWIQIPHDEEVTIKEIEVKPL